jgi:hypothetical protein
VSLTVERTLNNLLNNLKTNKMTAVEWLEDCLTEQHPNGSFVWNTRADLEALFKQAKEMEKQQIIDAHGNQQKKSGGVSNYTYILTGEKYYEETFTNHLNINPK